MSAPFTKDDWLKAWETRALDAEERLRRAEELIEGMVATYDNGWAPVGFEKRLRAFLAERGAKGGE